MAMLSATQGRKLADLNSTEKESFIKEKWEKSITPKLEEYIKIPNASPLYDPEYLTNGLLEKAANLIVDWVKEQPVKGLQIELLQQPNKTPLIFIEIPAFNEGNNDETVLAYAHFDKQPPLTDQWSEGLGPYTPVIKDGKLYGRGGADDGYGTFCAITAIAAVQQNNESHNRIVMIVEGCEESGSRDLPGYIDLLKDRIKTPSLVLCLDSGAGNYEQLWVTSSLRGAVVGNLKVQLLTEGVHSGKSGIASSTFRILRRTLDKLEDPDTGKIIAKGFQDEIPEARLNEAKNAAKVLGKAVYDDLPLIDGGQPMRESVEELILNSSWRPMLSVTGVDGMPTLTAAGNVLRPHTAVKLSLRLPPNVDATQAAQTLKELLESEPMYGAKITFEAEKFATGWSVPDYAPWLSKALETSSKQHFNGKSVQSELGGGSIPFMGMLGKKFPESQFVVTGVLGPKSNAHGPDEFLHLDFARRLTGCVADILVAQHKK